MEKKASNGNRQVAEVTLLGSFELGKNTQKKSGAEIKVFGTDSTMLGTIKIGAGSFEWWKVKAKKATVTKSWEEFAKLMESVS